MLFITQENATVSIKRPIHTSGKNYVKIEREQLIEGADSLGRKIEFTYQSQKTPNFKVVLEW